jgi:pilus assembly protein CpaB
MKGKMPIIIAVLLAAIAAYLVNKIIQTEKAKIRSKWKTVKVLVAAQDIKARTALTVDIVAEGTIPENFYSDSMLTAGDLEINRRRLIIHRISQGQPIYFHNLEGVESDKSLGQKLRPGGRAFTIAVNQISGIGYWMQQNDHVDILGTFQNTASEKGEQVAITLLENIVILKIGNKGKTVNNPNSTDSTYNSVTLLVLPEEAEMLLLAKELGKLSLSLRNPDDRGLMQERAWTTLKTLLTRERAKKLRMRRIQTLDTVRILRGLKKTMPGFKR